MLIFKYLKENNSRELIKACETPLRADNSHFENALAKKHLHFPWRVSLGALRPGKQLGAKTLQRISGRTLMYPLHHILQRYIPQRATPLMDNLGYHEL